MCVYHTYKRTHILYTQDFFDDVLSKVAQPLRCVGAGEGVGAWFPLPSKTNRSDTAKPANHSLNPQGGGAQPPGFGRALPGPRARPAHLARIGRARGDAAAVGLVSDEEIAGEGVCMCVVCVYDVSHDSIRIDDGTIDNNIPHRRVKHYAVSWARFTGAVLLCLLHTFDKWSR